MDPVLLHPIYVRRGAVKCACILGGEKYAAAGSSLGSVMMFPLDASVQPVRLTGHTEAVTAIDSTTNGIVITGSADGTVRVWKDQVTVHALHPNDGIIKSISAAEGKPFVLVVGEDGNPTVWNINTGEMVVTLPQHSQITCGAISEEGGICITGSSDGMCRFFDTKTGTQVRAFKAADAVTSIAICEDLALAVAGCAEGYITLFNFKQNEIVTENQIHDDAVNSVAFHPRLPLIITASSDNQIMITTVPKLKVVYTLGAHKDAVRAVAWSKSGDIFVSCGDDKGVFVWSSPGDEAIDEPEEEEEAKEHQEEEEDEFREDLNVSVHVERVTSVKPSPETPDKAPKSSRLDLMKQILEKVQTLSETLQVMEKRMLGIDNMIDQIEKAQNGSTRLVKRNK